MARSVLYYFTIIEHDFTPIQLLPFQRKTRRLPIVVDRGWSIWQIFCTQFVTQVSSASFVVPLHLCVFDGNDDSDDDGVIDDNNDDDDDDGNDDDDDE